MKIYKQSVCAVLVLAAPSLLLAAKNKEVTVNYAVKSLAGKSVSDAEVKAIFRYVSTKPYGKRGRAIDAITDRQGKAQTKGDTYGLIGYEVSAAGFYSSSDRLFPKSAMMNEKVVMLPVKKPVAMVAAKGLKKKIPVLGQPLGFDFMKLDWMPPHGEGEHQDALITVDGKWASEERYWSVLNIKFVDANCGVAKMPNRPGGARSFLRSGYEAPFKGYKKTVDCEDNMEVPHRTQYQYTDVHYFRIRAQTPLYGKLYGDQVEMTPKGPLLVFPYYFLNPKAGSRNVEFDPAQNLASERLPTLPASAFKVEIP